MVTSPAVLRRDCSKFEKRKVLLRASGPPSVAPYCDCVKGSFGELLRSADVGSGDAGDKQREIEIVAPVERERIDLLGKNGVRDLCADGFDHFGSAGDFESLRRAGDSERHGHVESLSEAQRQ